MKGMAKITALSCTEYPVFCKKLDVKETPHLQIYPTNPMPPYKYDGKMETKAVVGRISKMMPDQSVAVTKDNVDSFTTTDPTKPKLILFTNKKTAPTIWKALSRSQKITLTALQRPTLQSRS